MKRIFPRIAILAAVLLAACVPIPSEPALEIDDEVKAGISDLASAFARDDEAYSQDEYDDLINEIVACFEEMRNNAADAPFRDSPPAEVMAVNLWGMGFFSMLWQTMTMFDESSDSDDGETTNYEYLEGALAACRRSLN